MGANEKLFRAIVVLGAALTAPACDDDRCSVCRPPDATASIDASSDGGTADAPDDGAVADVIVIL